MKTVEIGSGVEAGSARQEGDVSCQGLRLEGFDRKGMFLSNAAQPQPLDPF